MMPHCRAVSRPLVLVSVLVCLAQLTACGILSDHQQAQLGAEEDRDGSGIGGTGIQGVITDFGSVVVNGLHVDYVAATPIYQDGDWVTVDALRLGQVVEIEAFGDDANFVAQSIRIHREVLGPISNIDPMTNTITVLNQRVVLTDETEIDGDVSITQMVAVSGLRLPDGAIVATRIDKAHADQAVHLYGTYTIADQGASRVEIGGLKINGLAPLVSLTGREVFVRGRFVDGQIIPIQVEPQPEAPFGGRFDRLSIAGFVDRETKTLGSLNVTGLPSGVSTPSLSKGLTSEYGIFEGSWSQSRSVFDIEDKADGFDIDPSGFHGIRSENNEGFSDHFQDRQDRNRDRGQGRGGRGERSSGRR